MDTPTTIAVIGIWHLGEVYSACLAELGFQVLGIDEDEQKIKNLQKGIPPLAEPRLEELLKKHTAAGRLSYTADFSRVRDCDTVWLTYDTPVDENDEVEVSVIHEAVEKLIPHLRDKAVVAISSQLPVGTSREIQDEIASKRPELQFQYFYSPENLRLGDAVSCFLHPERVVVGADTPEAHAAAAHIFSKLQAEILAMSCASAEMAKHALNSFLATCISFTNDLADMCESVGADIEDVVRALKTDPRVGSKAYLFAGLGFSGGTLGRDLKALLSRAQKLKIKLPVIEAVYQKNQERYGTVKLRLEKELGSIRGKTLAMFGVTYKAGTSTLRRSQPLAIEAELRAAGATLRLYDPLAIPEEVAAATPSFFTRDPEEAAYGADVILVMTPSTDLRKLDFKALAGVVRSPILFDTSNILVSKEHEIRSAGFTYWSIGR